VILSLKKKEVRVTKERMKVLKLLRKHKIPLATWGIGKAKTFNHLMQEITSGEAELVETKQGLTRRARGAIVGVYFNDNGTQLFLREDRQEFIDGRVRSRDLDTSVGEKLAPGEEPRAGALRALTEELGFSSEEVSRLTLVPEDTRIKGPVPSDSYPGLQTLYIMHPFSVTIPSALYRPEGYIERQEDKTSYFLWKAV
jgi:NUDIX domain